MRICFASRRYFADGPVSQPVLESDPVNIAYALAGEYVSFFSLRRLSDRQLAAALAGYDLVIAALDFDELSMVKRIAAAVPGRLATYSEGHLGQYQQLTPSGQLDYLALLRQAAVNFSYWEKYVPFFQALSDRPTAYLPYPYLLEVTRPYYRPTEQRPQLAVVPTGLAGHTRNGLVSLTTLRHVLEERLIDRADCWPDVSAFQEDVQAASQVLFPGVPMSPAPARRFQWRAWLLASGLDYRALLKLRNRLRPRAAGPMTQQVRNVRFLRRGSWTAYLEGLAPARLLIDMNNRETVGRNALDCAALGVPCVSTDCSDMQMRLFPQTTLTDPWDIAGAVRLCRRLLTDQAFHTEVIAYAAAQLPAFSVPAFIQRFDAILAQHPELTLFRQRAGV